MEYSHSTEGDVLHLKFSGDLIGENHGADLLNIVSDSVSGGNNYGVIDISKVRYINSSGIGVLITILTKFRNKGGELVLLQPSEHVKKLLLITKLNNIFKIVETEEEIEKALKS